MTGKLAIIGASYLQKPLVLRARELGFDTHVFAWQDGAVCENISNCFYPVSIRDIEGITKICRKIEPCGIVTIASDLASITVNEVAAKLGLIGNSAACSQATTNKFLMREKLSESGLPCPRYARIDDQNFQLPREFRFPLIVKPVDRSGSRGVSMVKNAAELPAAVELALSESFGKEAVTEEFIEGRELSVEAISWKGTHYILQYTDKITTGPPHFIEKAHHQPADLTPEQLMAVSKIITTSLSCLGVEYGASHSEVKINGSGDIYIIEIGARMGGDLIGSHLVQLSTGYDYLKGVIDVAIGDFNEPVFSNAKHSGVHYIFPAPGVLDAVIFKGDDYVVDHDIVIHMGDEVPEIVDSSQRPGYYLYQAAKRMEFDPEQLFLHTTNAKYEDTI